MSDDLRDGVPVEGTPDLSDLAILIINAETKEGRQLSFCVYPVGDGETMSMTATETEYGREVIHGGAQVEPVRVIPRRTIHTFTVTVEEKL